MQFFWSLVCLALLSISSLYARQLDVDISGGVYCVHDMKKVATAKVNGYNQGWLGYEQWVGTSEVADDGFYNVNETINTWHAFQGRLEIDHQCVNDPYMAKNITLSIELEKGRKKVVLAPIILDTQEPTKEQFEDFFKQFPYLRNLTGDFILNYKTPPAKWYMLWPYLKDLKIH